MIAPRIPRGHNQASRQFCIAGPLFLWGSGSMAKKLPQDRKGRDTNTRGLHEARELAFRRGRSRTDTIPAYFESTNGLPLERASQTFNQTLGAKLTQARLAAGMSQAELATELRDLGMFDSWKRTTKRGTSGQQRIAKYERGVSKPQLVMLTAIRQVLHCGMSDLLPGWEPIEVERPESIKPPPTNPRKSKAVRRKFAVALGKRIREARTSQNMSQARLGTLLKEMGLLITNGNGQAAIHNYESGNRVPQTEVFSAICTILGASPDKLLPPRWKW